VNAPLRRVAIAVFVLFGLLFANLNYVQFVQGDKLRRDPTNQRVQLQEYERQRGSIVVDGQAIAASKETDGRLKYLRTYPAPTLYPHVTGFASPRFGDTGIERSEDEVLSGDDDRLFVRRLTEIVTGRQPKGGNVVLTLDKEIQQAAFQGLQNRNGAIAALDPRTGEILAMVSGPAYDPNQLATHDSEAGKQAWDRLNSDPDKPLLNRALRQTYPPGSTFKVIVSAAALKDGATADTSVPSPLRYTPPQTTRFIQNFAGSSCGGQTVTLLRALTVSCNTAYARLGVELGQEKVTAMAREFGFEDEDLNVPLSAVPSRIGDIPDPPALAQSSIGQRDVRMTPLQGAMIAAAVANDGTLMKPYLVKEVQAPDRKPLDVTRPDEMSQPLTADQAGELQRMMRGVVQGDGGTGRRARISGVDVGGKTGTAEDGDQRQDHSWFIGYAIVDGEAVGAVAVVLENAGTSSSSTAEIAGQVLRAIVQNRGSR
jgi:peptidoglycan glycosyltransferase